MGRRRSDNSGMRGPHRAHVRVIFCAFPSDKADRFESACSTRSTGLSEYSIPVEPWLRGLTMTTPQSTQHIYEHIHYWIRIEWCVQSCCCVDARNSTAQRDLRQARFKQPKSLTSGMSSTSDLHLSKLFSIITFPNLSCQ